jgi:hypothetical protein
VCPLRVEIHFFLKSSSKLHNFTVLSEEPVAKIGAVGWNARELIA